jgi:hypothetical protein
VVVVPAVHTSSTPRPVEIADPSFAAYLNIQAGDPSGPAWTWVEAATETTPARPITLASVGLQPADTVGLGVGNLAQVIRDITGAGELELAHPQGHQRLRTLAAALTGAPALADDVSDETSASTDDEVAAELLGRYQTLRASAADTTAALAADGVSTDDNVLRAALGTAAQWGITPQADTGDVELALVLATRVQRAAEVLSRRFDLAPDGDVAASLTATELAEAIAELVAPEAAFPVSGQLPSTSLTDLVPDAGAVRVDPDWLETVAPVRPTLARLEAAQLEARIRGVPPMEAWTSRPDDIWQTKAVVDEDDIPLPSRLVVALGPAGTLPAPATAKVAAILVDRFVEVIPDSNHDSGVAFQHDLPDSRAPQAVLLAVPPVVDQELSAEVLVDIVAETRQLTRARVADPDDVGPSANTLHLAALSAIGRAGVRLGKV